MGVQVCAVVRHPRADCICSRTCQQPEPAIPYLSTSNMTDYLAHQTVIVIAAYHILQSMKNLAPARLAPSLLVLRR
jgi:hypothetical protein